MPVLVSLTTLVATWKTAASCVDWGRWSLAWCVALVSAGWGLVNDLHWGDLLVRVLIVIVAYRNCVLVCCSVYISVRYVAGSNCGRLLAGSDIIPRSSYKF
jgi:hypothetical protein